MGSPLAQAFAFLAMDAVSSKRFKEAAEQMQSGGFSDVVRKQAPLDAAFETLRERSPIPDGVKLPVINALQGAKARASHKR
jgi:hypothetical protein